MTVESRRLGVVRSSVGAAALLLGVSHLVLMASWTGVPRMLAEEWGRAAAAAVVAVPMFSGAALLGRYRAVTAAAILLAWLAAGWVLRRGLPEGAECGCLPGVVERAVGADAVACALGGLLLLLATRLPTARSRSLRCRFGLVAGAIAAGAASGRLLEASDAGDSILRCRCERDRSGGSADAAILCENRGRAPVRLLSGEPLCDCLRIDARPDVVPMGAVLRVPVRLVHLPRDLDRSPWRVVRLRAEYMGRRAQLFVRIDLRRLIDGGSRGAGSGE
jgi:hypothetical protein